MIKNILCFILLATLSGSNAIGQATAENEVADAVEALRKAMVDANVAVLDKITSADLSYGHSSGKVQAKTEFIDDIKTGKSDFVSIDLSDQTIKVIDNMAIVRHIFSASLNDNGKSATVKISILLVWQKQEGRWLLIARQAVKV